MNTYAVLGSTGQVGGSILEILLQSEKRQINAYARSKQKLVSQRPALESAPNVRIFEGTLNDIETLADCISGTKAAFLAIGAVDNEPGCSVARQQAKAAVEALQLLRKRETQAGLPQLVILSSATVTPYLMRDIPALGYWILHNGLAHIYDDLGEAEQYLREYDWIKQVWIKPGGLVHDVQHGHQLSTERQQTFTSYLDLAAGMVEVAEADDDKWDMKNVSVIPATSGTKVEWRVPYFVFKGMLWTVMPWLYPYLNSWLP